MASRSLAVAIARVDPAWRSLLDSEGVAWADLERDAARPEVVIVPSGTAASTTRACAERVSAGATGVFEEGLPPNIEIPDEGPLIFPYDRRFFRGLSDADEAERVSVRSGRYGKGRCFVLPFRLSARWADHEVARRHVLFDETSGLRIFEFTGRVVKKNLRRIVVAVLRRAFFERGLPFARKWYWPAAHRSVFCFRGDADGGPIRNVESYLDAVGERPDCASVFFCAGKYRFRRGIVRRASRLDIEVGSHNYWHIVFPDAWTNRVSLARAEELLRAQGAPPRGFVAPAYFWHPSLHAVLEERGYAYASCFGLGHDDLPHAPVVNGRRSPVLDIPFHCIGDRYVKFDVPLDGPQAREFFGKLIAAKYAAAEPILLYGHCDMEGRFGESPDLLRFIREEALGRSDVLGLQAVDLARWWRRRDAFEFRPTWTENERRLAIEPAASRPSDDDPRVNVETPDGRWFLLRPGDCIGPGKPLEDGESLPARVEIGPTDVGQVVLQQPEGPPPDRSRRRRWRRFFRAYAGVYLHDPDADAR